MTTAAQTILEFSQRLKLLRTAAIDQMFDFELVANADIQAEIIRRMTDLISRYAGPPGCGYEVGSFQHYCNQVLDGCAELIKAEK